MKKVSLKIKLTLLYTIFILVVVGTVLGILSVSYTHLTLPTNSRV